MFLFSRSGVEINEASVVINQSISGFLSAVSPKDNFVSNDPADSILEDF